VYVVVTDLNKELKTISNLFKEWDRKDFELLNYLEYKLKNMEIEVEYIDTPRGLVGITKPPVKYLLHQI
jgi:hypothetical protein